MNREWIKFKCINKLGEPYFEFLKEIVDDNMSILQQNISDNGAIYTMHDFNHHCCNLYRIISDLLLDDTGYSEEVGLRQRELYLLNLSVLLHDIGMFEKVDFVRESHSKKSAEIIQEKYKNPKDRLSEGISGLSWNEIKALKRIVRAHSDIKDGSEKEDNNGLNDKKLTNEMPGKQGAIIRAHFLANILRMADEMDVTNDRLGSLDLEQELENAQKDKSKIEMELLKSSKEQKAVLSKRLARYDEAINSWKHLKRLYLFKEFKRDVSGIVKIIIDDEYVEEALDKGESIEKISEEILSVYKKIYIEFERFSKDVNKDLRLSNMIAMKDIKLSTQLEILRGFIEKPNIKENKTDASLCQPYVLSEHISQKITDFVEKRNLYEVGHFKLHDNLCARDWISADEVIETNPLFRKCEAQFLLHLGRKLKEQKNHLKYLIVGIDFCGMLIASKLAYVMKIPYTYVIPQNLSSSNWEMEFDPNRFDRIVLVTDVIVTYQTIRDIIKKYNISEKVDIIYSVFFRRSEDEKSIENNQDLIKKTFVLNDYFDIELHTNKVCRYKNCSECKASNIRYS